MKTGNMLSNGVMGSRVAVGSGCWSPAVVQRLLLVRAEG